MVIVTFVCPVALISAQIPTKAAGIPYTSWDVWLIPCCIWNKPELRAERFCSKEKTAWLTVVMLEAMDATPRMKLGSVEFNTSPSVEYMLDAPV